jgi:hypothetical protein
MSGHFFGKPYAEQFIVPAGIKIGDRVRLKGVPGRWRVDHISPDGWVWLQPKNEFAEVLASLDPSGIVGVRRQEIIPDTTDLGVLL